MLPQQNRPRFIRKNGRIIPIGGKKKSGDNRIKKRKKSIRPTKFTGKKEKRGPLKRFTSGFTQLGLPFGAVGAGIGALGAFEGRASKVGIIKNAAAGAAALGGMFGLLGGASDLAVGPRAIIKLQAEKKRKKRKRKR